MDIKNIEAIIFDMDGVLWRAYQPIGDLGSMFQVLNDNNIKYVFASNNATIHTSTYLEKIQAFGIPVTLDQIFTSGKVTAEVLSERFPSGGNVYIVGENGLQQTLAEKGFTHSEENVLAVVGGLDFDINYSKLDIAARLIRNGAPFIGTNPDLTFPTPDGPSPGAGTVLAAIQAASGFAPDVIGKPQPYMFDQALDYLGTSASRTLVIGDRLETDIACGQNTGCLTAVVLTGVTSRQMAEAWRPAPDLIADDLASIIKMI